MNILLTGYTGNLGAPIARALSEHTVHALVRNLGDTPSLPNVTLHQGDLHHLPEHLRDQLDIIVHSAADTSFKASLETLRTTNVEVTRHLLRYASQCPHLRKFVFLSTTCVCGSATGSIPEAPLPRPGVFVNAYEESKWEAETEVSAASLPAEVVRLSIVAGSERDGAVKRLGALHHTLYWLWKGLIPMMPGTDASRVDIISTEYAAAVVAACVNAEPAPGRVWHGSSGGYAPTLAELIEHLTIIFQQSSRAWASGSIMPPTIVDAATFQLFEQSVKESQDLLFTRVIEDSQSFLPGLLHPRLIQTQNTDRHCHRPRADWRALSQLVTNHVLKTRSQSL